MPGITKEKFTRYIKNFDFATLFNELGWDYDKTTGSLVVSEATFHYRIVAKLRGFCIIVFSSEEADIPTNAIRKQISTKISQTFPENLLIFHGNQTQYWSYRVQIDDKKERYTETAFQIHKEADALFQRASGLFFSLNEYDQITFVDVKSRIRKGFSVNYDAVTKRFYDHFKKEHEAFKKAIEGIIESVDLDWYASVTLNRLMFCYFIQKKGFLDGDTNYLQKKLQLFIEREDETGFYSFYLDFLMVLFHDGLGGRDRNKEKRDLLGNIPYLNGGMFEIHELEQKYDSIRINNSAFKEVFNFFDKYKWHLDINPDAPGNEINPDVLGYIFEKYINQRAEMGAYYTKEDITGYIGKNTILPFLFDEVKRKYPEPFKEKGEIWSFLKSSGDEYIYLSIKTGIPSEALSDPDSTGLFDDLPDEIKTGLDPEQKDLWKIRKPWYKPAPVEIALPTEIYREVIERRNRYKEVKSKIVSGQIKEINDLITYNLDIINFTEDLLTNTQDPKLVEHFFRALEKVTILDPTCGSGAFLFAAMNILEPLYAILIERMRSFVFDEDRINAEKYASRKGGFLFKYPYFREILSKVSGLKDPENPESGQVHPNQKYFIFKSIILNNLYGVDIMREAVEIAKLRLFLKLVAQVHPDPSEENLGIEPLPDMDFNLKTGNTLVGFGPKSDIEALPSLLIDEKNRDDIYIECDEISRVYESYKLEQLAGLSKSSMKIDLKSRINTLNVKLHNLLYTAQYHGGGETEWLSSHKPFHWIAEFYEIMNVRSGFDIIIGNPPYVVYVEKKSSYSIKGYKTYNCGNLYAYCTERALSLLNKNGRFGFIVPNSVVSADKMAELQKILIDEQISWFSNFSWRPAKLFEGAEMRVTIMLTSRFVSTQTYSTRYQKWYREFRPFIFELISYLDVTEFLLDGSIPKIPDATISCLLQRMHSNPPQQLNHLFYSYPTKYKLYYFRAVQYWVKILDSEPVSLNDGEKAITTEMKELYFEEDVTRYFVISLLSSTLYFMYYTIYSSCQVINSRDFRFPINHLEGNSIIIDEIAELGRKLMLDYKKNSQILTRHYKKKGRDFIMEKQHYFIKNSKDMIDEIDRLLALYFGLNDSELDSVINYDIKFRLGEVEEVEE